MGKVAVAGAVVVGFKVLKWAVVIAAGCGALFVLWLWANAHFFSFSIVALIALGLGALVGGFSLFFWAHETVDKAELEERVEQYTNKYGIRPEKRDGHYQLNKPPRSWSETQRKVMGEW